ncbi:TIR domain-containing protein [Gelidibacter pelagius]|uniref:TIR domain-containing protein n=1 Tax=Gelidibacter pelagius TaxID=2819985 RepID=A0ABS3SX19_9FLAO|nr:TIR domain-containing protein [Gelidibacter pelagius]MBO3100280.1 TIR domain-containing protein [Gelidibacter pelagius]
MFKEVFISHAKEDYEVAEKIYDFLELYNYSPWLDKKKIKVGANWDYEIKKALKESTFVILLLSSTSVKKRGYVQKEFKYAIEYAESKLIDDIYIIPILIDKCEVPEQLNKFQWIEMKDENILTQVLESLEFQRQKYLQELPSELIEINDFSTISIDLNLDVPIKIDYECEIPLFHQNKFFDAKFINTFVQQKVLENISETRKWIGECLEFLKNSEYLYFEISFNITKLDESFLSLSIIYNSFLGGAHPTTTIDTLNFGFKPDRKISFREIIEYNNLKEFLDSAIEKYGTQEQKECLKDYTEYIDEENINFTFNDDKITIDFMNQIPRVILALGDLEIPRNP